jgi:predicted secreted Zn-dependent protease
VGRRSAYRLAGVVASALALGACGTVLHALDPIQLKVERSTTYYDVRGVTSDEIIEYLEQHSQTDPQGRRLVGSTASSIRLAWSALPQSASCYLQRLTIDQKLVVTLPRHEYADTLGAEARANWDALVTHIAEHEQRHVDIELDAARKMEREIRAMPAEPNCPGLKSAIDAVLSMNRAAAARAHRQFHAEEAARRQAARRPIETLVDSKRARLAIVDAEIWGVDRMLADLARRQPATQGQAKAVEADRAVALEKEDALARRAKLEEESKDLRATIDRLVEKLKFTW